MVEAAVTSALAEVECLRTLDRLRLRAALPAEEVATRRAAVYRLLEAVSVVEVSRPILRRAAEPFPTPLGTLDAIHLATAGSWRDRTTAPIVLATHVVALGTAARASGFEVIGV